MVLPGMLLVHHKFPRHEVGDIGAAVDRELDAAGLASKVRPGGRVAIAVGSRGISNIDVITRAAVDFWKRKETLPFIVPAMGSHGAATAAGQADVLAHYGITESTMGCPIHSSLDTVELSRTADGIQVYVDQWAFESDGVMLINRIKWHTNFEGKIESGLFKMMAIGLGKLAGAQQYHTFTYHLGIEHVVRMVGREVLKSGKILGGLAVLEDAYHHTGQITAVEASGMEQQEQELLATAKSWMARIPVDLDILIVDEIGKEISGTGMDTKVVNRGLCGERNPWPNAPLIQRIYVRGLSDHTYGNAAGIGLADIVHSRVVERMDPVATYVNVLTSADLAAARIPIHYVTDRECLQMLMPTVGKLDLSDVRIGWIRDTLNLTTIAFSDNLRNELAQNPAVEIERRFNLSFDSQGDLQSVFDRCGAAVL